MTASSPSFIRFVPGVDGDGAGSASILLGSTTGILQACPVNGDLANSQLMYAPLSDRKEQVSSMAVSSSGQLLCVGISSGAIAQYALGLPEGVKTKTNEVSALLCYRNPFTKSL
jgi:hypothetical protein